MCLRLQLSARRPPGLKQHAQPPLPHARCYTPRVEELLQRRRERQARFDAGAKPDWLPETKHVSCHVAWAVQPILACLELAQFNHCFSHGLPASLSWQAEQ